MGLLVAGWGFPAAPAAASHNGEGCAVATAPGVLLADLSSSHCEFQFNVVPGQGNVVWIRPLVAPPTMDGWTLRVQPVDPLRNAAQWPTDNGGSWNTNEPVAAPVAGQYGTWRIVADFEATSLLWQAGAWGVYACQGPDNSYQCLENAFYAVCLLVRARLDGVASSDDCHTIAGLLD